MQTFRRSCSRTIRLSLLFLGRGMMTRSHSLGVSCLLCTYAAYTAPLASQRCCPFRQCSSRLPTLVASAPATQGAMAENYSLWIKPKGHLYELLQQEIASQAKEFTGPMFEPHVTLLPDIQGDKEQIMSTSQQLAEKLKKFRINFLDVSQGSSFHKCVYILVAKEAAILEAGALAHETFGKPPADYMPHLSLLYADIDEHTKALAKQAAVQRLYGKGSNYSTLLTDNGFMAESISLWHTPVEDQTLASWQQVAEFTLSG